MAYTLRNSIKITLPIGKYYIKDSAGTIVYSGRVDSVDEEVSYVQVDLAPIFRQLVKPIEYSKYIDGAASYLYDSDAIKRIERDYSIYNGDDELLHTINIIWNYAYEYGEYGDWDWCEILTYGIQDYVYERQLLPLLVLNNSEDITYVAFEEQFIVDGNNMGGGYTYQVAVNPSKSFYAQQRVFKQVWNGEGVWYVKWTTNNDYINEKLPAYRINPCRKKNTITLYWLNLKGGLSWCHFDCKNIETNNITRTQIEHQVSLDEEVKFGLDNYNIKNYKSWTLNTGLLNDRQSELIQDLFKSPKVWLQQYDYDNRENGLITSVVLTDTKSTLKTFENDKMFNYTVNVRESKSENIYV